ncbi:hypothetical protein [Nocardia brasiliensis]|uniref:hypothetical protein n=1 Tax=Nocardia brasiliensis TaxID=37326 RepID=UPI003D8F01C8
MKKTGGKPMAAADNTPAPIEEPDEPTVPRWKRLLLRVWGRARTVPLTLVGVVANPELPFLVRVFAAVAIVIKVLFGKDD